MCGGELTQGDTVNIARGGTDRGAERGAGAWSTEAEQARRRRPGESGGPAPSALRAPRAPASPFSPPPNAGLATCAPCTPPLSPHSREPCASFLASPDCSVSCSLAAFPVPKNSSLTHFPTLRELCSRVSESATGRV